MKIKNELSLGKTTLPKTTEIVDVRANVNHIFIVDVSYSMCGDLGKIRNQLKNKLSSLMSIGDTISIVWFSGRNDAGILKEDVEIKSLLSFTEINAAIDKWLKPIGCTAFKKPLQLTNEIIERISASRPNSIFSMMFLTDGYNNDCSYPEVLSELENLNQKLSSSLFIEYGNYADTKRLTEMAGVVGGEKISCETFDDYEPVFEKKISQNLNFGKKVKLYIPNDTLFGFAYSVSCDGDILLYNVQNDGNNFVLVNENIESVYHFNKNDNSNIELNAIYSGIYLLSDKMMIEEAEDLISTIGDIKLFKTITNAYGKQKINEFKSLVKECVINEEKQFEDGIGFDLKVDPNAYCLLNFINDIMSMDNIMFYPKHPDFSYNRIGQKRISIGSKITDKEKQKLNEITDVNELLKAATTLQENKLDLNFKNTNPNRGYSVSDLVWNSNRANLSVRVKYDGEVELPNNKFGIDNITTYQYRTYTIIKDGIINISLLPLNNTPELFELCKKHNIIDSYDENYIVANLRQLPVINRTMVNTISANKLAELEWNLYRGQAVMKVINYYRDKYFPKTSKSYVEMLGQECADWLKEIGITDYNGFNPKMESVKSEDSYLAIKLDTKFKGYSSLPKVDDVMKKTMENAKINEKVMLMAISEIDSIPKDNLEKELILLQKEINKQKNNLMVEVSKIKFSLILSRKWFLEFKSFDEKTISYKIPNTNESVQTTFDMVEYLENL